MKISFGKYKDKEVCELPLGYLKWLEEEAQVIPVELRKAVQHEIKIRTGLVGVKS